MNPDCQSLSTSFPSIFNASLTLPGGLNVATSCCSIPFQQDLRFITCTGDGWVKTLGLTKANLREFWQQTGSTLEYLEATFSPSIGNLTNLEALTIRGHAYFTGSIPSELSRLKKLTLLDLSNNNLKGPVPTELANNLVSSGGQIQQIYLNNNQLNGPLPFNNSTVSRTDRNCFDNQNVFNKSLSCGGKVWCAADSACSGKSEVCDVATNTCVVPDGPNSSGIPSFVFWLASLVAVLTCVGPVVACWWCRRTGRQKQAINHSIQLQEVKA
ncbi:hypothetical protein BDR26DRAFT_853872 [Obelidium mucronatum]|nr:hypothetical protein BDR26DRAFT_853872 [Obelidium mucronatum]